ncbi:uncharacterized protein isoform X2 [Musca autumnalis]|uniref:uncharacterized protein isoform X2 n=1 Tax=Musca autumnalis TaxID=221902 RepID=UPI003CF3B40B
MAPPVRRSPPTLRSIASADTITSDQPDHEAQVDVSSEAYGNTQATPRTETNNQTMSSAVHSGTKKPASNNCASDNNAITETPKGNVSSQKKTVSKSGNAMKATEPGTSSQQREVDNIADIKKQMAYLKRQLLETKSQLAESQRQCQQLEVMSQKPSRETWYRILLSESSRSRSRSREKNSSGVGVEPKIPRLRNPDFNAFLPPVTNTNLSPCSTNSNLSQQQHRNLYGTQSGASEVMVHRKIIDLPESEG